MVKSLPGRNKMFLQVSYSVLQMLCNLSLITTQNNCGSPLLEVTGITLQQQSVDLLMYFPGPYTA